MKIIKKTLGFPYGFKKQMDNVIEFMSKGRHCVIYKNHRRFEYLLGCSGNLLIIKLSDGRKIKTNDLWYIENNKNFILTGEVSIYNNEIADEVYIY